jgi:hypothetical protein
MRPLSWITIAVLCAACGILGYIVLRQKAELAGAQNDASALKAELGVAKEALAKANKQRSVGQRGASGAGATKAPSRPARGPAQLSDIFKDHPEFVKLYSDFTRRQLGTIYGAGLNSLNLSPQQLNRLKDLLAERQMSVVDAMQAAAAEGIRPASVEWQQAVNQASLTDDQEIKDILGPNAEATLDDLKSNAGRAQAQPVMEYQVNNLSPAFGDAGIPLTTDQSAGLTQALLNAWYWQGRDLSDRPVDYNDVDPSTGLTPHETRNLNNAAQVLTPDQLNVLQNYYIQMEQVQAIQRQYRMPIGP